MMQVIAVIPARYGSTRLPGKPLLQAKGKPLIQYVWEGVQNAPGLSDVLIATDDERILEVVRAFGAKGVMTRADHPSGSDRVFEVVAGLSEAPDAVLNIQGDEPGVTVEEVVSLISLLKEKPEADLSTLACPMGPEVGPDPARVKVVIDGSGWALYFSRAAVPYSRTGSPTGYWVHTGLYGYRFEALKRFVALPPSPLEKAEGLEQLRAMEAGMRIAVGRSARPSFSIDTQEDFQRFLKEA
ncbi:MAG: 3-deoxy-manno-octulosonate cytidylyltransferase [Planctomycetota bacterium]|jgi:3-deoxy-manno-octulosonate cytidylyltransferase (CMP-KDO synthetase)